MTKLTGLARYTFKSEAIWMVALPVVPGVVIFLLLLVLNVLGLY